MSLNASWAPQESQVQVEGERQVLIGAFLGCVAFGSQLILYIQCLSLMLSSRNLKLKSTWFHLAFVTLLFMLGVVSVASGIDSMILGYIDNRNYPGGPNGFGNDYSWLPVTTMGFVSFVLGIWLQDGFLLYRFLVIWGWNWWLFIVPCLSYIASIALSVIVMIMDTKPNSSLWNTTSIILFTPFWALSIGLNVLLTSLIAGRLLYIRVQMRRALGDNHAKIYTSISAVLIESASLYCGFAITYVVMYALSSNNQNYIVPILNFIAYIAPMLISYRVASGRAYTSDPPSFNSDSGIVFAPSTNSKQSSQTKAMRSYDSDVIAMRNFSPASAYSPASESYEKDFKPIAHPYAV